jgi:DNA-binding transcriptional ArsR family regulator
MESPPDPARLLGALANQSRQAVLEWLIDPVRHFPPQRDGDLIEDGVCSVFLADKLEVSQPTTSRHMRILEDAGLVVSKRQKGWTFYRRDEEGLRAAYRLIGGVLGVEESA